MLFDIDKEGLQAESEWWYIRTTIALGLRRAMVRPCLLVLVAALLVSYIALAIKIVLAVPWYMIGIAGIAVLIIFALGTAALLYALGHVSPAWKMYRDFLRVGFTNAAGEAPLLIGKIKEKNYQTLYYYSKGLTDMDWHKHIEALQSALNMSIAEVRPGRDHRTVIVRAVAANTNLGTLIPWTDNYVNYEDEADYVLGRSLVGDVHINIDKQPMLLIGGSTGSGKTMLSIVLLIQALVRGARVYVFDAKGLDYFELAARDAEIYTQYEMFLTRLQDVVSSIHGRIEAFREKGAHDYNSYIKMTHDELCRRRFVLIDECAEVLDPTGRSKEEKEVIAKITACLNTIARMGRAVGVHLIISTQRPDANAVPGSIKSNLDVRICGKADATLSTIILGDGRADELIPKYSQGRFVMADGAQDIVFQGFFLGEADV